jgi:AGCS family alanine or glycine:cation symporter
LLKNVVDFLNGIIWSMPLIFMCLGVGLWFSLKSRFLQVRHIKHMIKIMLNNESSDEGVSSFQALAISISGRVGTGNIAGVATAIALGGPGAMFWMWTIAFLGASSSYVESVLAQIYKTKQDGEYRGGPAYYIEKGLGIKWYAVVFAVATLIAMGLLLPSVQSNSIAAGLTEAFNIPAWMTGAGLAVALAAIIFGGVKRIAKFAEVVVPVMAIVYVVIALYVLIVNASMIPSMFGLIFRSAFGAEQAFAGIIGAMIKIGVKRGIYSNEAGQGTCPHAAAAAEVDHPASQGLVQAFGVYIDTLFICTATGLMILITGTYNTQDGAGGFIVEGLPGVPIGPGYTQAAVESAIPGFGSAFVAFALLFFAFTTILAYYYIAETNVAYLKAKLGTGPWVMYALKGLMIFSTYFGAVKTASLAWGIADIGVGMMAWLNIIAIVLLQKPAFEALRDYEAQLKAGVEVPVYDSSKLEVKNATFWEGYTGKKKAM